MIGHLEMGSMKPDDLLARKLEHFLKIQLFVPIEDEYLLARADLKTEIQNETTFG